LKKFLPIIVLWIAFFIPHLVYAQEEIELNAKAAVLMDGKTGRVLYGKEENTRLPNASTTKILTCILALEYGNLEDVVTVSKEAASMPDVQLNIVEGEEYRLEDLLYSLMLESHNDSAKAIAEYIEQKEGISDFSDLMNYKAKEIGCTDTHFVTPNGLDADYYVKDRGAHETTARDLALIMRYCLLQSEKSEEFLTITRTESHSFTDVSGERSFTVNNHNSYLSMDTNAMSGKTGFTNKAGYCYVGAVKMGEEVLIVSLLACGWPPNKSYKWSDMKKLIDYGEKNYTLKEFLVESPKFPTLFVKEGKKECVKIHAVINSFELLAKEGEEVTTSWQLKEVYAPIKKGQQIGWMRCYLGKYLAAEYPIVADEEIEKKSGIFGFVYGILKAS
jgi:D-alanyl-D-alanine carboxypeptidase (penicillin-binding protein 5/6)